MAESNDSIPNKGIAGILAIILGAGGFNVWSESAENEETEQIAEEFRLADIKQDDNYDDLLQLYNDLNLKVSLLEQQLKE